MKLYKATHDGVRAFSFSFSSTQGPNETVCVLDRGMLVVEIEKLQDDFLCLTPHGIGWIYSRHMEQT